MVLGALVGYEIFVVAFAVVMLASLIGVSILGLAKRVGRMRPTRTRSSQPIDRER